MITSTEWITQLKSFDFLKIFLHYSWNTNQCSEKMEPCTKLFVYGMGRFGSYSCSTILSCYWTQATYLSRL